MIEIVFKKEVTCPLTNDRVKKIVRVAATFEKKIRGVIDITIVGNSAMRRYNYRYRGINRPTDVLSFGWQEDRTVPSPMLGELLLNYPYIVAQAKRFGVPAREECGRMLVHGLLHIVGYDHVLKKDAATMFALQEKIVSALNAKKIL